jgi:cytochrome c
MAAWNIDVMPDGDGLPEGKGTPEEGDAVYEAKCIACHFDFGTGGAGYPALQAGNAVVAQKSLKNQRTTPDADGPKRVFGSYWPKASTLWWYIKTGMPHPAPMSLSNDEVYALVAYMLSLNEMEIDGELVVDDYELDREKFLQIKMPNEDGFEPKIDGENGIENVRTYFNDYSNYGNGTRCMHDCFDGEPTVLTIQNGGISDYSPALSTQRDLPAVEEQTADSVAKSNYENSCSLCHSSDMMGAPVVGNKETWSKVLEKGMSTVMDHALNGFNAMPPRGGSALNDKEMEDVVNYMINNSK